MGVPVGDSVLLARDVERKAFERQWKEYVEIFVKNINNISESADVLREMNGWLANHAFLGGTSPSPIDFQACDLLYDRIASLSYSDKENVIHLSRCTVPEQFTDGVPGSAFLEYLRSPMNRNPSGSTYLGWYNTLQISSKTHKNSIQFSRSLLY